ncbi:MAG: prepilin-type N-terminal cleavage/methylation domain-containing protein [Candidatus Gastranaerophilales bacterium]|nr:prepilin-type N-terminal cleavage/methylation domain-containing protein [Candidatus Gastranaerophilales bacterium]
MDYGFKTRGFTLAEALITLVIIGVIAALTIPAILVNTEQHEYKSSLKKALSALNQVIELNIALEGYGPIEILPGMDNEDSIYNFFRARMNVISTSEKYNGGGTENYAFFTADGMRYEFPDTPNNMHGGSFSTDNSQCARNGMNIQDDAGEVRNLPCLIIVDVNGERKPNPRKARDSYKVPSTKGRSKILDVFPIIITDVNAYPFGIVAQRAMFQHD